MDKIKNFKYASTKAIDGDNCTQPTLTRKTLYSQLNVIAYSKAYRINIEVAQAT